MGGVGEESVHRHDVDMKTVVCVWVCGCVGWWVSGGGNGGRNGRVWGGENYFETPLTTRNFLKNPYV